MLHLNEHIKGLDVDKSTIRRVTYLTDKFEDYPVRMLQLERLERPEDMHGKGNKTETYWKGKHGYLNAAHIAMPYK